MLKEKQETYRHARARGRHARQRASMYEGREVGNSVCSVIGVTGEDR